MEVSKQQTPIFTVFSEEGFQTNTDSARFGGLSLQELIDRCIAEFRVPRIAWAAEGVCGYGGGTKSFKALLKESIAAGRLIENIDGKWVARGVQEEVSDEVREAVQFLAGRMEVRKAARKAVADPNAAMIARDGPAKTMIFGFDYAAGYAPAPVSTAKPNPFPSFRNPDSCQGPADHLNAARHQMAGMKG